MMIACEETRGLTNTNMPTLCFLTTVCATVVEITERLLLLIIRLLDLDLYDHVCS